MLRNIQSLGRGQRLLLFALIFVGGLLLIALVTAALVLGALNANPRTLAAPAAPEAAVREFAILPDDDAFPSGVAVGPDGIVYTASYKTGVVWAITPDGQAIELPNTRDGLGAVSNLTVGSDGALYVVDKLDADVRASGGLVRRVTQDGQIADFARIADERGFVLPHDLAFDRDGRLYVSDRGRDEVWRFEPDGSGGLAWWRSPAVAGARGYEPTGLAYDPVRDALLIADGGLDVIYRVAIATGATEVLYQHTSRDNAPGFDGLTVTPAGVIYAAALSQNGVARVDEGRLYYLATGFRGASDVAFAAPNRLYVTNFEGFSLAFPVVAPRLPFALDVIELSGT